MDDHHHAPHPRWLMAFLDFALDLAAPVPVALVLLFAALICWPIMLLLDLLHTLGANVGNYAIDFWQQFTPKSRPCWNNMVMVKGEPAEPRYRPPPGPPKNMTPGEEKAYMAWVREQDYPLVYTPQPPKYPSAEERKAELLANDRKVEAEKAAARKKAEKAWQKKYGYLKSTHEQQVEARKVFVDGMNEAMQMEHRWNVTTPESTAVVPIKKPAPFGPAPVGVVQCNVERLQHHKFHWMISMTSDRQVLYKDMPQLPGTLTSRQIGEYYFGRQKQTYFCLLKQDGSDFSSSSSSPAHQKMVREFADYLFQFLQQTEVLSVRQSRPRPEARLVKWSGTDYSGSWDSPEHLKVVAAYGYRLRGARSIEHGHGVSDDSNEPSSNGQSNDGPQGGPSGNSDSNKRSQEGAGADNAVPAGGDSSSTNPSGAHPGGSESDAQSGLNPDANATSSTTEATSTPSADKPRSLFDRITPADPPMPTSTDDEQRQSIPFGKIEAGATSSGGAAPTTPFATNTGASTDPFASHNGAGRASTATGGNVNFSGSRHSDTRRRAPGPRTMADSPRQRPSGASASPSQGGASSPTASQPRHTVPVSSSRSSASATPPPNPIMAKKNDADRLGLIKFYTTALISKFHPDVFQYKGFQVKNLNADLKLLVKYMTWILEWITDDETGEWDDLAMSEEEARSANITKTAFLGVGKRVQAETRRRGIDLVAASEAADTMGKFLAVCKYR